MRTAYLGHLKEHANAVHVRPQPPKDEVVVELPRQFVPCRTLGRRSGSDGCAGLVVVCEHPLRHLERFLALLPRLVRLHPKESPWRNVARQAGHNLDRGGMLRENRSDVRE